MCTRRIGVAVVCLALLGALGLGGWAAVQLFTVVRVAGESMHPALHTADVCLVRRRARVRTGDIILYAEPGYASAVLHRVTGRASDGYVTRGDANPVPDFRHLAPGYVCGRVIAVIPVGALLERWRGTGGGATLHNQSQTARR